MFRHTAKTYVLLLPQWPTAPCLPPLHPTDLMSCSRQAARLIDEGEHTALEAARRDGGAGRVDAGVGGTSAGYSSCCGSGGSSSRAQSRRRRRRSSSTGSQVQAVLVVHEIDVAPGDAFPCILLLLSLHTKRAGVGLSQGDADEQGAAGGGTVAPRPISPARPGIHG